MSLVIGDLFDDVFWSEVPAAQFVVAVGSLFLLHAWTRLHLFQVGRRRVETLPDPN